MLLDYQTVCLYTQRAGTSKKYFYLSGSMARAGLAHQRPHHLRSENNLKQRGLLFIAMRKSRIVDYAESPISGESISLKVFLFVPEATAAAASFTLTAASAQSG